MCSYLLGSAATPVARPVTLVGINLERETRATTLLLTEFATIWYPAKSC